MHLHASDSPGKSKFPKFQIYETERFFIAWKGVLFEHGCKEGIDSVKTLAINLEEQPLAKSCQSLHGIFVLIIFDHRDNAWSVLVDNAGLYHVFHWNNSIDLSFLEALSMRGKEECVLCPRAAAEFLAHGAVAWSRTFVKGVAKIAYNEIIELRPPSGSAGAQKAILPKELPERTEVQNTAFLDHYRNLAAALQGRRVSVDVTGGIDSRLVACLLSAYGLEFEVAVVGRPGHPDVAIAETVADVLGKDFNVSQHDVSSIEEELPELFRRCDGLGDILAYHSSHQLSADRRRRGIDVAISGVGGELCKDFWWIQDWPFYNSKIVNFGRLYDLRIRPVGIPQRHLAGDVAEGYAELRQRTIEKFGGLRANTNTESYDNVYFFYKMAESVGRFATTNINNDLAVVASFLDYDNFRYGASLPRSWRFLNRFHRMTLTTHCPALAKLPTTEGVSASIGRGAGVIDLVGFGMNRSRRLVKKIGERMFRRHWMSLPDPSDPDMIPRVRRTAAFRQAIEDLKSSGVLNPDLAIDDVRNSDVGRMLTLGMLVRHIGW